ncbi:hypothetical protein FALCPG4_015005 [Fusarium falciforme]
MTPTPLPSFNQLFLSGQGPRANDAVKRLFWILEGPLESSIFVLDDPAQPEGPRQPYFQQTLAGTTWHPVSQEPMTTAGVSSITVKARSPLDDWQASWKDEHRHADPDDEDCVFEEAIAEDGWVYDRLLRCCGEDLPPKAPSLVVEASDKPYVTVHDYLTAVHPWLLPLRQNILSAMSVFNPVPAGIKLVVDCTSVDGVNIREEGEWIRGRRPTGPVVGPSLEPFASLGMQPDITLFMPHDPNTPGYDRYREFHQRLNEIGQGWERW